jgi:hypothetical protein
VGVIFPISAAILRDRRSYDQVLETFSKPLSEFIDWHWTSEQEIVVTNDTGDLYRYFDATVFAEYLYDRVADTVRRDLKEELGFVAVFDQAPLTLEQRMMVRGWLPPLETYTPGRCFVLGTETQLDPELPMTKLGFDQKPLDDFKDIREIQRSLKTSGLALTSEADESTNGPASLTLIDPDGNTILIDQHVN